MNDTLHLSLGIHPYRNYPPARPVGNKIILQKDADISISYYFFEFFSYPAFKPAYLPPQFGLLRGGAVKDIALTVNRPLQNAEDIGKTIQRICQFIKLEETLMQPYLRCNSAYIVQNR